MRRIVVRVLVVIALLLAIGVGILWLTSPSHRIYPGIFPKIQEGMTEGEVERILRAPPGTYASDGPHVREGGITSFGRVVEGTWKEWYSDEGYILILFDEKGRVARGVYGSYGGSVFATARRWLGF